MFTKDRYQSHSLIVIKYILNGSYLNTPQKIPLSRLILLKSYLLISSAANFKSSAIKPVWTESEKNIKSVYHTIECYALSI